MFRRIRPLVFGPALAILLATVVASFVDLKGFLAITSHLNSWVLNNFSWLFDAGSLYMLILAVIVYFSPLGRVRIGGANAEPLLSRMRWFSITLCTTLAVGILFWTTAEPLYDYHAPPSGMGIAAASPDAARFEISTMYLHWTLTRYAIYAMPAVLFALVLYNRQQRFSIASLFEPVFGFSDVRRVDGLIDSVALYALVAGMASSLGTGVLTITGGIDHVIGGTTTSLKLAIFTAVIVATFVISAATGLQRGIARLSSINAWLLIALGFFVLGTGPTRYMLGLGVESLGNYLDNLCSASLYTGTAAGNHGAQSWSVFYWAVWFAWAPVTSLFLGRIAQGYTVREFININLIFPAFFSMVWIIIFSTTALKIDMDHGSRLYGILSDSGIDEVLYTLFGHLPLSSVIVPILLFIAFISYVTAADSNTDAIGNIRTHGLTADSDMSGSLPIKVVQGRGDRVGFLGDDQFRRHRRDQDVVQSWRATGHVDDSCRLTGLLALDRRRIAAG